jgi:LuxR family maltose regulon positive regulatory protein
MSAIKNPRLQKGSSSYSGDLLATKLSMPILRSMLVRRARLTELLWVGMQRQVTLVVAPAGYGKTTLLGEWLATLSTSSWPIVWVSLDKYDNDLLRFWSYIVAALQNVYPPLQYNVQEILRGKCGPNDCTQLNPLINEIADIRHQFSLILDDYHEIQDQAIHRSLAYFIEHLPENCHLIVSSRVMPLLPLSRLRARGQLMEISAKDLSFTLDETGIFISQVMHLDISWDGIVSLMDMTEGWIAGLQLAALSLQRHQDPRGFVANFAGSHRHILDYLTEEVLNHQDEAIKEFLLETSILNELSAPLCDAVLGQKHSREMLEDLEQANLFIIPLEEHRRWYRYHALFADMLRMQLERSKPDLAPRLHLAACHWLRENGYPEKAVYHALAAGEAELAANIVESCALQAIIRLDIVTVVQWFKRLPEEMVKKRPRLMLYSALANLVLGKVEDLEEQLCAIEESLEQGQTNEISALEIARLQRYVNAVRAAAACTKGVFSRGIRTSQKVLENLPPEDYFFLGLIQHYLAYAYQASGRLSEGAAAQERACRNALNHEFHKEFVISQSEKARFYRLQGRLRAAAEAYRKAVDYAGEHGVDMDVRVYPLAGLADILQEWNQISAADELLVEPINYFLHPSGRVLDWFYTIDASLAIARNQMLHGKYKDAARFIHMADKLAQIYHFIPELYSEVHAAQVRLWLTQGDLQSAASWVGHRESQSLKGSSAIPAAEKMAMARVYLAIDRPEQASLLLTELLSELEGGEQGEHTVKSLILYALAQWHMGARDAAADTLSRALIFSDTEARTRSFINEGTPMRALLSYMLEAFKLGKLVQEVPFNLYIERLLKQWDGPPKRDTGRLEKPLRGPPEVISPLVEPLSERELEILALWFKGYSAGDVAKDLVISVNTAKAHIKSIYQKLDVHSRKEAIERAIALRLLAD